MEKSHDQVIYSSLVYQLTFKGGYSWQNSFEQCIYLHVLWNFSHTCAHCDLHVHKTCMPSDLLPHKLCGDTNFVGIDSLHNIITYMHTCYMGYKEMHKFSVS